MNLTSDKKWVRWFGGAALAGLIFLNPAAASAGQSQSQGTVGWVIDGDTFQLDTGERIRFIGIDTPEYQPWEHRTDFYGKEAFLFTKSLLKDKKVLAEGYARERNYPPDSHYQKTLKEAEKEAKALKKGLWAGPRVSSRGTARGARDGPVVARKKALETAHIS